MMKKMFKTSLVLLALLLCFASLARADGVGVKWNMDVLSEGELSAELTGAEDGLTAVLALYEGDMLVGVSTKTVEDAAAMLSLTVTDAENACAKLMLWSWDNITPATAVVSMITPDGITPEPIRVGDLKISAWVDADGEEGQKLPGAAVTVKQGETEIAKAETDENGEYLFKELTEGEYTVEVTDPAGREAIGENPITVAIADGETTEVSFGFKLMPAAISGVVWNDADRDGEMDEGEEPMAGAVVMLGEIVVTTGEDGTYKFESLTPNVYTVKVEVDEDYICTTGNAAAELRVSEGEAIENNVGLAINIGAVSGVVWIDANRNGVKDEGEITLFDVEVTISSGETVNTDENGAYSFAGLKPGTYSVSVPVPSEDYELTTDNTEVEVFPGEETSSDIGFALKRGSIVGFVWLDENGNGEMDEGEGLEGVTVSRNGDMSAGLPETVTDENGAYSFVGLEPGEYAITITLPVNMLTETESVTLTVAPGGEAEADFMLTKATAPGSIEGIVWNDDNGNGIQDEDEEIARLTTVTLTSVDGSQRWTASTGWWGDQYLFEDMAPGEYILSVSTSGIRRARNNPRTITVISGETITEDFGLYQLWLSDNQLTNNQNSIGYHEIEPALAGKYTVSFELTVVRNGDNAIMLGDSSNGTLGYNTSSAILLFPNNGYFGVRTGNGNGSYTDSAQTNLCEARVGETYTVTISGDITDNTYRVSVTGADGEAHTSGMMRARTNGAKIDTIALISNGTNTSQNRWTGAYTYNFHVDNFMAAGGAVIPDEPDDPAEVEYNGFAGLYYGITVNGRYIRGNSGKISADYTSVRDTSAQFLPRDMADGTFALLCRSSNRRITTADQGAHLVSGNYALNDLTQHWYLEESENYTPEHLSYYLRSADNDVYIGLSNGYLAAVSEANKVELVFNPLKDESPLYLVSKTAAYGRLTAAQRERIVTFYETVAGDALGRYGGNDFEWGVRGRLDAAFDDVLSGELSESAQLERLAGMLNSSNGHLIDYGSASSYNIAPLPGVENLRYEIDEGTYGNYDFWRGTMLNGTRYELKIYDGSVHQQTITLYVHDDGIPRQNSQTFLKVITKIPYVMRKNIKTVKIRSDSANSFNCGASDLYIRINWNMSSENQMLGTLTHELHHSLDQSNGYWSHGAPWAAAMAADMIMVTGYSNSSVDEDFAEFGKLYVICHGVQDREKAMQILFPNRYASYWRLRHNNLGGFELWEDTEYLQ